MSHIVSVENGKFTFVDRGAYAIDIQRDNKPWAHDMPAARAIAALMCELDAARVVLEAARQAIDAPTLRRKEILMDAIDKHDRLVDDHTPPSDWTK